MSTQPDATTNLKPHARENLAPTNNTIFSAPSVSSSAHIPFSQRSIKKAPTAKPDEIRDRRRSAFLRKVRDGRDERRFEARSDDILRSDWLAWHKRFEAEMESSAPPALEEEAQEDEDGQGDENQDLPMWSQGSANGMRLSGQVVDEEQVDEVAGWEERELEALLEFMPEGHDEQQERDPSLWSDDADYDALFDEVMGLEDAHPMERDATEEHPLSEQMDMS